MFQDTGALTNKPKVPVRETFRAIRIVSTRLTTFHQQTVKVLSEGLSIPLSISAGVAAFPELHIKTAGELLLLADEALYAAKEQGRNRVVLAPSSDSATES